MGLYDTIVMDGPCAKCGTILNEWQTKQLGCIMMYYTKGNTVPDIKYGNVVGIDRCKKCNYLNWARIKIKNYIVSEIEIVMPFEKWIQRIREIDELLDEVIEPKRDMFWDLLDSLMEEYRKDIMEDDDTDSSVSYDLAWNIIVRKLFDWLPINVVRAFFREAIDDKVK